jgi:hypothetical protein
MQNGAAAPRALLVFVDGIGFGRPGAHNPFTDAPTRILGRLGGEPGTPCDPRIAWGAVDATLGHAGLPQSATGQATIFTGHDAIALVGGHLSGFPTPSVAKLLGEHSFLRRARDAGRRAGFLNAFDPRSVARLTAGGNHGKRKPSASTLSALAGGGMLSTIEDAFEGRAATFDVTGEICNGLGFRAPRVSIEAAARAVALGARSLDVALFEMFLTDKAGHSQDIGFARREILRTDSFLSALFDATIDDPSQVVVVTSDHGNLEDLSNSSHTRSLVPLLAWGGAEAGARAAAALVLGAESLLDVAPRLLRAAAIW